MSDSLRSPRTSADRRLDKLAWDAMSLIELSLGAMVGGLAHALGGGNAVAAVVLAMWLGVVVLFVWFGKALDSEEGEQA